MLYQFAVFFWTEQGFTFWTGVACVIFVGALYLVLRPAAKTKKSTAEQIAAEVA